MIFPISLAFRLMNTTPEEQEEISRRVVLTQAALEKVREDILQTPLPMTYDQRLTLDKAILAFRAAKDALDDLLLAQSLAS